MRRTFLIVGLLCCVAVATFTLLPRIALSRAKSAALRKLELGPELELTPSAPILIRPLILASEMSQVEISGCTLALPQAELRQNVTHKTVFTNDSARVFFITPVNQPTYAPLERQLNCSNAYDLISKAYRSTPSGISEQRTIPDLQRYIDLLTLKRILLPKGTEHFWAPFDRGDFKGFMAGDLAKDGTVAVEIYLAGEDRFVTATIKEAGGQVSDVYRVLSLLSVKPNETGSGKGRQR